MDKRIISLLLAMLMTISLVVSMPQVARGTAEGFTDVTQKHWAFQSIGLSVQRGIVNGYPDGTFRPDAPVKEAEFLAMLFRAYPEVSVPEKARDEQWFEPYFSLGGSYNWPVWHEVDGAQYNRGRVAQVVAASQGELLDVRESIQYLLDHKLSNGMTSATIEGYGMNEPLTRAQAVTFIENMKSLGFTLKEAVNPVEAPTLHNIHVRDIVIGDTEASVIAKLGEPARKDDSEYGFQWYIYNQDYATYAQIGIKQGKVVGLYTNSDKWATKEGVTLGTILANVRKEYGDGLDYILKGNTQYYVADSTKAQTPLHIIDDSYVTFFIDIHEKNTVTAVQVIEKNTEQSLRGYYGEASEQLKTSFERQMIDLANAVRKRFGQKTLAWDDNTASISRAHSKDMSDHDYFAHNNLRGKDPFERLRDGGIAYSTAAENIARGYPSAIFAHEGLMNSTTGHRENILNDAMTHLGVGIHLDTGDYRTYFTQNFYTPK